MFQITTFFRLNMIIVIIIMIINAGCSRKQKPSDTVYSPDISAFTSGVISMESNIRIRLSSDFPVEPDAQKPPDAKLFEIKPEVTGNAYWIDQRTIEFRPENKLLPGTSYKVKFRLSKLFNDDRKKDFHFQFKTIDLNARIELLGFKAYN